MANNQSSAAVDPAPESEPLGPLPIWQQIRWGMILTLLLVALLPLVGVELLTLVLTSRQSYNHVYNQLQSVSQLKANQIEHWLGDSQLVLEVLATGPFEASLANLTQTPDDPQLEQLVSTALTSVASAHDIIPGANLNFTELFLFTPEGRVIASSEPVQVGKVVRTQPYFDASLTDSFIQPPYYAVGSGELTMVVTRPIRDASNQVVAVLAGRLDLTVLANLMLERSGLGASGETYLVSLESSYLLTPSRFEGYSLNQSYHSQGIDAALRGEAGSGVYMNYQSPPEQVLGVYRWVPELQAGLIAEVEATEAFAGSRRAANYSLGFAAGIGALVIVLALLISSYLSKPIAALTDGARRVAEGELDQLVTVHAHNELGVLSRVFNTMTEQLRLNQAQLEQRVAERTAELEHSLTERNRILDELQDSLTAREQLKETVRSLSMPVVAVHDAIIVMPLIGEIDAARAGMLARSLMDGINEHRARIALIDVTGVPLIDSAVAEALLTMMRAAQLLGTHSVLVGVRPEIAQSLLMLDVDLSSVDTRSDLKSGIQYALELLMRRNQG